MKLLKNKKFEICLWVVAVALLCYYALEVSCLNYLFNGWLYTPVNILCVLSVISLVYLFVRRWWIASGTVSILTVVLSFINYYTVKFKGQPVSTQDIHNAGTALNVLDSYKFEIGIPIIVVIAIGFLLLLLILKMRKEEEKKKIIPELIKTAIIPLLVFVFAFGMFFSENSVKPKLTIVWSWKEAYKNYGFIPETIEIMQSSLNPVTEPEGYSNEKVNKLEIENVETKNETPDIIFILNETLYDVSTIMDIETDIDYMTNIRNMENAIKGSVIVPGLGGGTNRSEFEFLTGNSNQLTQGITPFNSLNFNNSNTAVSHLEKLGYRTWSAHPAEGMNYSRQRAYPAMGFDEIRFTEDFTDKDFYGKRPYLTDKMAYKKMLEDYGKMGDNPRFMYLLTIQNHGNWDILSEEDYFVRTKTDLGENTDDMNEFLSCMYLSDMAFKELTDKLSETDRKVIVCMAGDHCPSFLSDMLSEENSQEMSLKKRATPFIIWANFPIQEGNKDMISLNYLLPLTLKTAGVKLSPYYSYMLDMMEEVPVTTAFNVYVDKNGEAKEYGEDGEYRDKVNGYLYLEYNNIGTGAKRNQTLFEPVK